MPYDLSFVNLGITIQTLNNHITVFGFSIAYYGIIIGLGMLAGLQLAMSDAKRRGQDPDLYLDFAIYAICFAVIGARLYYVIFSWDSYKNNLLEILNLRGGGLAIYGAVIAAVLTLIVYSRIKKQSFFSMADTGVLGLITGQIMGRWGNFFNAEAFGGYTEGLFAMQIRKDIVNIHMLNADILNNLVEVNGTPYIQVHPTFLYESFWNLCVLLFLLWYRKKKKFDGEVFLLYLGGYGLGRAFIESLRTDSLLIPGTSIPVSQLLACGCVLIALVGIIRGRRKNLNKS
ncbi:MAG: prolipoprotein diacylglyceryl transferase [Johnsonella sp.]|nr:prolipoprotein diacylglyceryl transferase [Johnsonella sp.]